MEEPNVSSVPASTREVLAFHIAQTLNDVSNIDVYLRAARDLSDLQMLSVLARLSHEVKGPELADLFRQEINH